MRYAVAIYHDRSARNEIRIIDANNPTDAMQIAVDGHADTPDTTIEALRTHYWEHRQITLSDPVLLEGM